MMIDLLLAAAAATTSAGFGGPADIWASIVHDFSNITEPAAFAAFLQVLMIDLVLAGDNAIVVGALAAGLPAEQRKKVILIGVIAALVLRIVFALIVTQLMQIVGLILAGGLLLLWVAWRMWRDLHHDGESRRLARRSSATSIAACGPPRASPAPPGRSRSPTSR